MKDIISLHTRRASGARSRFHGRPSTGAPGLPIPGLPILALPILAGPGWVVLALALLAVAPILAAETPTADPPSEQLVVFTSSSASTPVAQRFSDQVLQELRAQARQLDLAVEVVDVDTQGAPAEIHGVPAIVHQNARGRSFFQGRYVDIGKVAHFVRTSRAIPPVDGRQTRADILTLELGRAKVVSPIKITELAGDAPLDLDPAAFRAAALRAIADGSERYELRAQVELGPSDRAFYFDFYPYRSADGRFHLSTALFSQFDCIEPVFESGDSPISGPWAERDRVFAEAARQLEAEVLRQLAESELGDGFYPVPETVAEVSWQDLGLALPAAGPGVDSATAARLELGRSWQVASPSATDGPRLVFRFPSPLERYSGEVGELDGRLELGPNGSFEGAAGFLEVETSSVTMGEDSLDEAIRGKMIMVESFPRARFDLQTVVPGAEPVAFGKLSRFVAKGSFSMMGHSVPIEVRGQVEPLVAEDGQPRLRVNAGFSLRLADPFGVEGPDGPLPARDTLDFFLDFLLRPAESASGVGAASSQ